MKKIILYNLLFLQCFCFISCMDKEDGNSPAAPQGLIYGKITDLATGNAIINANVSLRPKGETTLTGNDGMYEFHNIADGNYYITVSKAEYIGREDENVISIINGSRIRRDLQIEKKQENLRITDVNGNDITYLDFGSDASSISRTFNIFNNGTEVITCNITYSCVWINSISTIPNNISPGQTVSVTIEIDRTKLLAGENTTSIYIQSNHGDNILEIRAIGQENLPVVLTLPVTNPDGTQGPYRNTFHGNVTNEGYPPYTKRGFCWSSTNINPTISDNQIEVPGNGLGEYSYTWWGCWDENPGAPVTYYVRAWVKYGTNNTVIYGSVLPFIFNDFK